MRYRTIVADPPWEYPEGWPGASTSPLSAFNRTGVPEDTGVREPLPYAAMSLHDIGALPIPDLVDGDSHLFLWTTNRYLREAYPIVEHWGFKPSQLLTWCKPRRGIGPRGLFASSSEFVLYARRGHPFHKTRVDSTWWEWPRHGHSTKPEAFLDLVETVCPGPYLELFARRNRLGWDTWGNESLEMVQL